MRCMRGVGRERTRPWVNIIQKSKAKYTALVATRRAAAEGEAPPAQRPAPPAAGRGTPGGEVGSGERRADAAAAGAPEP